MDIQLTDAQRDAIAAQADRYSDLDTPCAGLDHYEVEDASAWGEGSPEGAVAVSFRYLYGDDRDGTGLEVTIFDREGNVLTSQDYG